MALPSGDCITASKVLLDFMKLKAFQLPYSFFQKIRTKTILLAGKLTSTHLSSSKTLMAVKNMELAHV